MSVRSTAAQGFDGNVRSLAVSILFTPFFHQTISDAKAAKNYEVKSFGFSYTATMR